MYGRILTGRKIFKQWNAKWFF